MHDSLSKVLRDAWVMCTLMSDLHSISVYLSVIIHLTFKSMFEIKLVSV